MTQHPAEHTGDHAGHDPHTNRPEQVTYREAGRTVDGEERSRAIDGDEREVPGGTGNERGKQQATRQIALIRDFDGEDCAGRWCLEDRGNTSSGAG